MKLLHPCGFAETGRKNRLREESNDEAISF